MMNRLEASQWLLGGSSITPGQDVLDGLCLLLDCRELLGKVPSTEKASLRDRGVKNASLVSDPHLSKVVPEMSLLDHQGGHRPAEGLRCDLSCS